jgi:hypothetical protein
MTFLFGLRWLFVNYSTFFSTIFPRLEIIFSNMSAVEVEEERKGLNAGI